MTSAHYSQLAFFQEVTQGTGPADAAAWLAAVAAPPAAYRIAPLAGTFDPNGIGPGIVDNERVQDDIFDDDGDLIGINNPTFPFETYCETPGAATVTDSQIALTAQMVLVEHELGGLHRTFTRLADSAGATEHSTTEVEVTSATGFAVGCGIAVQLQNYTGVGGATVVHPRIVTAITGAVLTVDEPFPVAPVDGDIVHATATGYVDSTVLDDSDGSGGPFTLSWVGQRQRAGEDASWEVVGAKAALKSMSFERDGYGKMSHEVMGGDSLMPGDAASPVWVTGPANEPPMQVGRQTMCWYQDYGGAHNTVGVNALAVEDVGVPVTPVDTITTEAEGMQARCGYTTTRADTKISLSICDHDSGNWTDFRARTYKALRFYALTTAGNGFAVHFPRCQTERPEFLDAEGAATNGIKLKAFRDTTTNGTTQLARSKIKILWY